MRRLLACLIIGASLTACSSNPIELPTCDVPAPLNDLGQLLSVPDMPSEVSSTESTATFDLDGLLQFERLRVASVHNKTIGDENTAALAARNAEINELIECARYQKAWMEVREDMLQQEKRDHFIDNLWHRGLIVLIGVGVAL